MENRREFFKSNLSSLYLPKYEILCNTLCDEWQPFYGMRTFEESQKLYSQGRSSPGQIVSNAKPGFSPHNYGCASDWTIFDVHEKPIWMNHDDPRWDEYRDAIKKANLAWGANFHNLPDWPHNELPLDCSWGDVGRLCEKYGYIDAQKFIEEHVLKCT